MRDLFAQNDGIISFLLYLVLGIFWIAGKLIQQREARRKVEELRQRREKREHGEPVPNPKPRTLEDDLQEFLGRMAGLEPEPEPAPPPPPRPLTRPKPVLQFDQPPPPPPPPLPRPAARNPAVPVADPDAMESYAKIQDIEDIAELELDPDKAVGGGPDVLLNVRSMMIDMSRSNLRMNTVRIPTMRMVNTQTVKPDLQKPGTLKHAIVSGILLNPPKALTPDPFHQEPGQL